MIWKATKYKSKYKSECDLFILVCIGETFVLVEMHNAKEDDKDQESSGEVGMMRSENYETHLSGHDMSII